jgi:serine/threonine-protein kinase
MDWERFYNHFREPDFIPGYEIQNRLGGGAFGEVYKARKASIGKAYAIKFLKIDDDAQREAVERELEQVRHFAAIDHPNLVTIEDLGTVMGVPYLIMGYAGEDTLARALKSGRLEPGAAFQYFVQACRGVLALHDRRLVHFDLKPSNIFLKGDIARVGDYGLSKMMTDGRLTLSFGRGTPQYMAPEMIKNRADHRADVYSLGVILFESMSGQHPFESEVPGTIAVREDDRAPSFPPEFPAPMRAAVVRCLRLSPDDRYPGVGELLAALGQAARSGDSVRIEPDRARTPMADAGPRDLSTPVAARTSSSTEARQAAAELARGAVEVARGVWDGLRTIRSAPRSSAEGRTARPPAGASTPRVSDLPHAPPHVNAAPTAPPAPASFDTPPPPRAVEGTHLAPPPAPRREPAFASEALAMYSLSEGAAAMGDASPVPPILSAARSNPQAGTIPVPPAQDGGWLATLASSLTLAAEVLVSLVRGLARRSRGPRARSAVQQLGVGAWRGVVNVVRLVLFVLALAMLGGVVTWIVIVVLRKPA